MTQEFPGGGLSPSDLLARKEVEANGSAPKPSPTATASPPPARKRRRQRDAVLGAEDLNTASAQVSGA